MAKGRDLCGRTESVIAFIGDGSMSEGEAFEGLDNAGEMNTNLIIIFNDNEMSIAPNHGGIYKGLAELRATNGASEHNLFRAFGLDYRYVADGQFVDVGIAEQHAVAEISGIAKAGGKPVYECPPRSCSVPMASCSRISPCKAMRPPSSPLDSATPSAPATIRTPTISPSP